MFKNAQLNEEARKALDARWETVEEAIRHNREKGVDRPQNGDSPRPEQIVEMAREEFGTHPLSSDVTVGRMLFETIVPYQFDHVHGTGNPNLPRLEDPVLIYVNTMQYMRTVQADLMRDPDSVKWSERLDTFTRTGTEGLFHPCLFTTAYKERLLAAWTVHFNMWLDHCVYANRTDSPLAEEMAYHLRTGYVDWAAAIAYCCGGLPAMRQMSILGRPVAYTATKQEVKDSIVRR